MVILAAGCVALNPWRLSRAAAFAGAGDSASDATQAALNYRYANVLAPEKPEYITALAEKYLQLGLVDNALTTLRRLPITTTGYRQAQIQLAADKPDLALGTITSLLARQSSAKASTLESRIFLELNRSRDSVMAAEAAVSDGVGDSSAQFQLGLAYLIADRTTELHTLAANLTSLEARKTLAYAESGKYQLAVVLANGELLRSAERAVGAVSSPNSESIRLEATIRLARYRYSPAELQITADRLIAAVTSDPANIQLHQLLQQAENDLGQTEKATEQAGFIKQLQTGTP